MPNANFVELRYGEVRRIPLLGTWVNKGPLRGSSFFPRLLKTQQNNPTYTSNSSGIHHCLFKWQMIGADHRFTIRG
jgi:hypothetical protein